MKIPLFNLIGLKLNAVAIYLNISEWLFHENFNRALVLIISLLAIVWWLMKIYDQYLITRKRKRNE